uniref:Protein p13 MTCP-1 n=1 Tax=Bos mutus grunniens TaxID=30521 RepID=A0A8C0AK16_BOSMU
MAGQDVGAPPDRLWVHQEGVYRDEYQRTWVAVLEEETSFLRARVQQVQVPLGDAARPSHLLTSQLPLMWQLYPEERYMDNNSRLWQIQHHLMVGLLLNHFFFFHCPGPLMTEYSINFSFSGRSGA